MYSLIAVFLIFHLGVLLAFLLIPEKTTEIVLHSFSDFHIGGCFDENKKFELCASSPDNGEEKRFSYSFWFDDDGKPYVNMDHDGTWVINAINEDYAIVNMKTDGMHSYKLKDHVVDQLLYLNDDTKSADVMFQCFGSNRLFYGNDEFVIVYNGEKNTLEWILLEDESIIREENVNFHLKRNNYFITISEDNNSLQIERRFGLYWFDPVCLDLYP